MQQSPRAVSLLDSLRQAPFGKSLAHALERYLGPNGSSSSEPDFAAFLQRRRAVASAYFNGDAGPLDEIVATTDPVTFFSPGGDVLQGARPVAKRYDDDARRFSPGGTTELEILQSGSSGELAFWTGLQRAQPPEADGQQSMVLRVTEVFRIEHGGFKLIHRHADVVKT